MLSAFSVSVCTSFLVSFATGLVQTTCYSVLCFCNMIFAKPVHLVILLQSTCSHEICETGRQSPPFRLVTWSASGSWKRMAISTVSEHNVHTNHKMATTNETTMSSVLSKLIMENFIDWFEQEKISPDIVCNFSLQELKEFGLQNRSLCNVWCGKTLTK